MFKKSEKLMARMSELNKEIFNLKQEIKNLKSQTLIGYLVCDKTSICWDVGFCRSDMNLSPGDIVDVYRYSIKEEHDGYVKIHDVWWPRKNVFLFSDSAGQKAKKLAQKYKDEK